ncbi:T9SS type A sorting domain-containing protein [Viscerimonas tarda]
MKQLFLLLIGLACTATTIAQIGEGGTPPSFKYKKFLQSGILDHKTLRVSVKLDRETLEKEDRLAREIAAPLRIAVSVPVLVDISKTGEWSVLAGGEKIWQQSIQLPEAQGLIVSYKDFYIPKGAKLFIYNEDKSEVLGAYTETTNPNNGGEFSTQMLSGDKITLEYVASEVSGEQPRILINDVGYVYNLKDIRSTLADELACMVDINCAEGDNWQKQKRGVVHIRMKYSDGWYVCSGSLINNTAKDKTPYILTAGHCFYDNGVNANFETAQFYFNYENSTCKPTTSDALKTQTLTGCDMKVNLPIAGKSDGLLLQLKSAIPTNYNVYYNGWDANNVVPANGVVIHHPDGTPKKISTYTQSPVTTRWENTNPANSFWEVKYAQTTNGKGVTAGGSSGSPLFNQNGLIIGTLTGGSSYCVNTYEGGEYLGGPNEPDWYGRLWYHFDQSSTADQKMKTYLDPTNSGVKTLPGYDPTGGSGIYSEKETVEIVVFPNPVENELNINVSGIIEYIRVFDMLGQQVYESAGLQSSTAAIPVQAWAKGVYLVVVKTERGLFTDKIVKK